ncbi:hypothetical protein PPL_03362 [Heterostelium album PN500]|uniref:Uncharacterized protein n=1 Tax=Heterostelium pallidum (strain ATCC 26659 / Pp 5 / PN500) TaxID=670386 RepID=D3B4N7_HETP5|nr:hypothetical protein PPL_03362 [Heterostelium album PN500]EFA84285.1 hypothetical protein PPL_03362 [Heterostelium album PN500]|eukprot:XP_020436401.1 hypothetical protein PPL_03362 [Heterostelium album PN500]
MSRRQKRNELDSDYLDDDEQKDLISSLLEKDQNINLLYLKIISVVGFVFGALKICCAVLPFTVLPFENEAHGILRAKFSSFILFWLEWMSASAFIAGGIAMYPGFVKGFIKKWIMLISSVFTFFGSLLLYLSTGSLFTSLWTLGVNSVFLIGCLYISHLTNNTQNEIQGLNKFRYPHKKA